MYIKCAAKENKTMHFMHHYMIKQVLMSLVSFSIKTCVKSQKNEKEYSKTKIKLRNTSWTVSEPTEEKEYTAQIRYHGNYEKIKIKVEENCEAMLTFETPQVTAPGQSIVIYDDAVCIGGGVIAS